MFKQFHKLCLATLSISLCSTLASANYMMKITLKEEGKKPRVVRIAEGEHFSRPENITQSHKKALLSGQHKERLLSIINDNHSCLKQQLNGVLTDHIKEYRSTFLDRMETRHELDDLTRSPYKDAPILNPLLIPTEHHYSPTSLKDLADSGHIDPALIFDIEIEKSTKLVEGKKVPAYQVRIKSSQKITPYLDYLEYTQTSNIKEQHALEIKHRFFSTTGMNCENILYFNKKHIAQLKEDKANDMNLISEHSKKTEEEAAPEVDLSTF